MEVLSPANVKAMDYQEILESILKREPFKPFDPVLMAFAKDVSDAVLSDRHFRGYPDMMAAAHWMRASHIKEVRERYESRRQGRIWLPRGTVVHFAPANVDTVFIYSWIISFLLGNKNIIRLSQGRGQQVNAFLQAVNGLLENKRYQPVSDRNMFICYGHEETVTGSLCAQCDVRVIWGGDETVRLIRQVPLPPYATEIVFADKFSLAAIKSKAVTISTENDLNDLAGKFYNDAFWFNQNACSSPRMVVWIGSKSDNERAKKLFWDALKKVIERNGLKEDVAVGLNRMLTGYSFAAEGLADRLSSQGTERPYRLHINDLSDRVRTQHAGGGVFLEMELSSLSLLTRHVTRKDQTLSVYGFDKDELSEFSSGLLNGGVNRVVQVGQALEFDLIWDGFDLFTYLSREITVK
ncbi:MAG: hypothetical protein JW847_09785 [Candidatus Omnitrophica bacterium]|nr:hypothetical protein [Candidatus Omnitrophota bacterium]